jgi:hypothetical protein
MSISKRALLGAAAAAAAGLSADRVARAQTSGSKSTRVAKLDEGEVIRISPRTGSVHKSNTMVSAEKHRAALAKGAREIGRNTVIYRQNGKLYIYEQDEANTEAAENFQTQFDNE